MLSENKTDEAVAALQIAAKGNPLPEYEWSLADALRTAGKTADATALEQRLKKHGATNDPRTYSLYLATRHEHPDIALELARAELQVRRDVFTFDAVAWASLAADRVEDARAHLRSALAEGTQDARLFYHAGVIALTAGDKDEAANYFQKASPLQHTLLPSEREGLLRATAQLNTIHPANSPSKTNKPPTNLTSIPHL